MNDYESQSKKLLENLEGKLIGEYLINNMDTASNQKSYPLGIALLDLIMVFMTWRFDLFDTNPLYFISISRNLTHSFITFSAKK